MSKDYRVNLHPLHETRICLGSIHHIRQLILPLHLCEPIPNQDSKFRILSVIIWRIAGEAQRELNVFGRGS